MNRYTDEQILEGLSKEDLEIALKVISHINFISAYGHNPEACEASGIIKRMLDPNSKDWTCFDIDESREKCTKAIRDYCHREAQKLLDIKLMETPQVADPNKGKPQLT